MLIAIYLEGVDELYVEFRSEIIAVRILIPEKMLK